VKHFKLFVILVFILVGFTLKDRFTLPKVEYLGARIDDLEKRISTSDPLRAGGDSPAAFLTRAGIIKHTNDHRQENGLAILLGNTKLNEAASKKVQDMFAGQYFAHVSPEGKQASDLATFVGYEYIAIGENLALGNFENDQVLVQAWMDSPGHRANILDKKFQEIGVAASKGIFEGKSTWLAVQIFGLSKSACPTPNSDLKTRIDNNEKTLKEIQTQLVELKNEIEASGWSPRRRDEYNQKVKEYNDLAEKYNSLLEMTKNLIEQYNEQAKAFNSCVKR